MLPFPFISERISIIVACELFIPKDLETLECGKLVYKGTVTQVHVKARTSENVETTAPGHHELKNYNNDSRTTNSESQYNLENPITKNKTAMNAHIC